MIEYKHIFFDLDHTLWDFDRNSSETLVELYHSNNLHEEIKHPASFVKKYKEINARYWDKYNHGKVSKEALRLGRFRDTFVSFNILKTDDFIEHLASSYLSLCPTKPHLIDGTHEILQVLEKKFDLHIISNGFIQPTSDKLRNSGLEKYFKTITSSEEVGINKPDPRVFNVAMEKAGCHSGESIMIGDNLKADIIGALNVGMMPILFRDGKVRSNPKYYHVNQLRDIPRLLEELEII